MNRKLFGKPSRLRIALVVALFSWACSERIPGNPEKIIAEYLGAVQKGDFATMYKLNRVTARQKKYVLKSNAGNLDKLLSDNYEMNLAKYNSAVLSFMGGVQWQEKYFFPRSAVLKIGRAHPLIPPDKDARGENWEKGLTVLAEVSAEYPNKEEAPEYDGQKLRSLNYACTLSKIREEGSLMVYSQDLDWYVDGCIANLASAKFAQ